MTTRGKPIEPTWTYLNSSVDLRRDVMIRLQAFFSYEKNCRTYPTHYTSFETGLMHKHGVMKLCQIVVEELGLKSVKANKQKASQTTTKKTMVLVPFTNAMEAPDMEVDESSNEFSHVENLAITRNVETPSTLGSQELLQQTQVEGSQDHASSNIPEEWYTQMEEIMELKIRKMKEDLELNFDVLWSKRREGVIQETQTLIADRMKNVSETQVDEKLEQYLVTTGESMMDKLMTSKKDEMVENVTAVTTEVANKVTQKFQTSATLRREQLLRELESKESKAIKQIAQKRDVMLDIMEKAVNDAGEKSEDHIKLVSLEGDKAIAKIVQQRDTALGDINEEVAQAIIEIQYATEQDRVEERVKDEHESEHTTKHVTPSKPMGERHPKFMEVDEDNLHADPPPIQNRRHNNQYGSSNKDDKAWNTLWSVSSFHKQFKAKLKSESNILSFYQQLYVQGPDYGIHVKRLEDIQPNEDLCPTSFNRDTRNNMARTIYQKLQDDDCVSVSYEKAQQLIEQYSSSSDGYKVLAQLLRFVHPNLQQMTSKTYEVPTLSRSRSNLYRYGDKMTNYILNQRICNRWYSEVEKSIMFLNNLDTNKYTESKQRALAEIRQIETSMANGGKMDPNLMIESLPTTIEQYHMQLYGNKSDETYKNSKFNTSFIRNLMSDESQYKCDLADDMEKSDDEQRPTIRAFGRKHEKTSAYNQRGHNRDQRPMSQCRACGRWGCNERKCYFTAKVHLALKYMKENGSSAVKLAEEYLRINSKRTKMSTIRTLASMDPELHEQFLLNGDKVLQDYDVAIPMETIDFEEE